MPATAPLTATATTGPRIVEHSRGTAHPQQRTTRDRVTRSLLLRPETRSPSYVRR
ncbi:MAG TPA: hypothetical protein VN238_08395 [Solirubrobacteraceae bacterium]|nr:hypothetical protein [Solirubrobacteraceae bacterium]